MTKFCKAICGECEQCRQAWAEAMAEDAAYASLSIEDAESLTRKDPDDPRTFALDAKGRP